MGITDDEMIAKLIQDPEGIPDRSTVSMTLEQRDLVDQAIAKLRSEVGREDLGEGRCLAIICVDFLQSFMVPVPERDPDSEEDDEEEVE